MNLLSIGISHHTAPLEVRERLWFSNDEIRRALVNLRGESEVVLFSTCNRTELYVFSPDGTGLNADRFSSLLVTEKAARDIPENVFMTRSGTEAVSHLFAVASGIDSLVIGDVQILAQLKEGLTLAQETDAAGFFLTRLFQAALHAGRRARSETRIGEGAVSVSYAAVELAEKIFERLSEKRALVLGAGEMAQLTAKHLRAKDVGQLLIVNRTRERSDSLAAMVNGTAIPFEDLIPRLNDVDILISSIASDEYVFTADQLREINKKREGGALFIIDIGVPRNIDPAVRNLENVFLYDLDSLNGLVRENEQKRKNEIPKVERIIAEELREFGSWFEALHATPTIAALMELVENIRKSEVDRNINRFDPRDRELVELVTRRIVKKILHTPIINLKNGRDESHSERLSKISALRKLFGIDREKDARHDT
jgi:glutamyl-tRNA reductase